MIGQTIGHYQIEARLGEGGMGEVYRAVDTNLGRRVALKILPAKMAHDPKYRTRFKREAKAIAALNHPNIVTIHSVEEANGIHFITMELIEGTSLSRLVPEEGMPLESFLEIAVPLADAVSAAHRAGITHRDLKPDNVMIDTEGRLRVFDFGLAKLDGLDEPELAPVPGTSEETVTEVGKIVGTVAYMSPEQAEGGAVDLRSDVFSLGIIFYQMVTGGRPFTGDSNVSVLTAILRDTPSSVSEINPKVPKQLARIIERCLAKQPERRYSNAGELCRDLGELRQQTASGIIQAQAVRRRLVLPMTLAVALVVIIAVVVAVVRWQVGRGTEAPLSVKPSIAVLPFENFSADPDNGYFSDGITEEITSKLSRIDALEVASRTSVARYRGSPADARQIGRELGVRYLLEGSVRKAGDRVRITAQLVDTSNGFHLWADDFDGDLGDVFRLQEETALEIAEALDLHLSPGEQQAVRRRYTTDPKAYDAYLRGRALLEYFDVEDKLTAAREHFERALDLDPDYPLALIGLSRVQAQYYRNLDPDPQRLELAEELARRALEIDDRLAEAHLAMGQVLGNRYDYHGAAESFREAIRLEPRNAYAWDLLSWALTYKVPPDAPAAEEAAREAISLQAALIGAHYHLGRALLLQHRHAEAIDAFNQAKSLDPGFSAADFGIAQVHYARGEYDRALQIIEGLRQTAGSPVVVMHKAAVLAARGDTELALEAVGTALAAGYRDVASMRANRDLAGLMEDPRCAELLEQHGIEP